MRPRARRAALPEWVVPERATLVRAPPEGEGWLHEIKLDGYRLLVRIDEGRVRLLSRNGKDWTATFPRLARAARSLGCRTALLDGEAVVLDRHGVSEFQALQRSLGRNDERVSYFAFDLLHLDGADLTALPLRARKEALRRLLATAHTDGEGPLRYGDHVEAGGGAFFREACRVGLEGVVSKRADSPYRPGRSRDWLKVKCLLRQELLVVGYTEGEGSRVGLGALVLGVNEAGRLRYAGRVGTGFSDAELRRLRRRLEPLATPKPPVEGAPGRAELRGVRWVAPRLCAEVSFSEWTRDGVVRQAVYKGLREDVLPGEVVRERADPGRPEPAGTPPPAPTRAGQSDSIRIAGVLFTHPEKVLYPDGAITKRRLALYYREVADRMLPHLAGRPLTLLRCPEGSSGECFFQKHAHRTVPTSVPRVRIREEEGTRTWLTVDGLPALLSLVQIGALEFHVGGARAGDPERPDQIVFDLDPDPSVPWPRVPAAARTLRARLEELGLRAFVKGTGGKGLHVVTPLEPVAGWDEVKGFARAVAREMARRHPAEFTAQLAKKRRAGRIFIDYLRNGRGATAIAPWSTRARPGAPVAIPLGWDELGDQGGSPPLVHLTDVAARLASLEADPWARFDAERAPLTPEARREVGAG